jgi:hypothetical protein
LFGFHGLQDHLLSLWLPDAYLACMGRNGLSGAMPAAQNNAVLLVASQAALLIRLVFEGRKGCFKNGGKPRPPAGVVR